MPHRSLLVALLILVATPAWAQQQTGSVSGRVTTADGEPLPGAVVMIDGRLIPPTTAITRANGTYTLPAVPPADDYVLEFALSGFARLRREPIVVELQRDTQVGVALQVLAVTEAVEVSAASPVVDVRQSGLSSNFTREHMQQIPSARDPWALLRQAPAIQLSGENVGLESAGSQKALSAYGSRAEDNVWAYDGAEITSMANVGGPPMYFDFDAFEEVSVDRAGNDPSVPTAGIRISIVTRRGGDTWRGSGRFYFAPPALQSYTVADPETGELVGDFTPDDIFPGYGGRYSDGLEDWGLEIGGPLLRDRLFGWGAYGTQDIRAQVSGQPDNTQLYNWHGKLNWHVSDDLVANFTFLSARKTKQGRGAGAGRPEPTTQNQDGSTTTYNAKFQYTIGSEHFLEGTFNHMPSGWSLEPRGGLDVQPTFDWATFEWGRSYSWLERQEPTTNARLDGSGYVAGANIDHELRYGYSFRRAEISSVSGVAGDAIAATLFGEPLEAWLIQGESLETRKVWHGLYIGDTLSAGRLVANLGLRYDYRTSEALPSSQPAHPFAPELFPAVEFPGYDPGFGWDSLSPRLGLTYDISGSGRTIARLSAGRYYSQGSAPVETAATTRYHEVDFEWFDLDGDTMVDPGETGEVIWVSSGFDIDNPNAPTPNIVTDTDPPITDELLIGVEHELDRDFAVAATAILRHNHREVWTITEGADDPDYWFPGVQQIPGWGELELYLPAYRLPGNSIHKQRPNYDERFRGFELEISKRMSRRWMANASFTWGLNRRYFGPGAYTDPTNLALEDGNPVANGSSFLGGWGGSSWNLKASGLYQLPAGLALSGFLQVRDGLINPAVVQTLPRGNGWGRWFVLQEPFGSTRLPTYWNLDLRTEKTFDLGTRGRLHLIADAFNVTNNGIVLGRVSALNVPNYGRATDITAGRTFRLGMRLVLR